jgi:hypothetical protein
MRSDNLTGADNQQETLLPNVQLDPDWIAGFVDGDGCFSVSVHGNKFMHGTGVGRYKPFFTSISTPIIVMCSICFVRTSDADTSVLRAHRVPY